jgi:hypothetical protein
MNLVEITSVRLEREIPGRGYRQQPLGWREPDSLDLVWWARAEQPDAAGFVAGPENPTVGGLRMTRPSEPVDGISTTLQPGRVEGQTATGQPSQPHADRPTTRSTAASRGAGDATDEPVGDAKPRSGDHFGQALT